MKPNKVKISKTTEKIFDNMLKTRLEEIFEVLDSDEDGQISANKIDIKHLSTYALEIFAPLLCEMEEVSLELDKQTFI